MTDPDALRRAAEFARDVAVEAFRVARDFQGRVEVRDKGGRLGPVTEADLAAERIVLRRLAVAYPDDPVFSEETRDTVRLPADRVWCVDPIDGTREYVEGLEEWAVQIGLVEDGRPVAGACALGDGQVLWAYEGGGCRVDGDGAGRRVPLAPLEDLGRARAVRSRRPGKGTRAALEKLGVARTVAAGGVGYKVSRILLGHADLYLHWTGRVTWWDTAAPAALLLAAGGTVTDREGGPLDFRHEATHKAGLLWTVPGLGPIATARLREQ